MIKTIIKVNSKWILLFLFGLFSIGVQATEWDENGVVKVYDKVEDYLKDNPCVSVDYDRESVYGEDQLAIYMSGHSDFENSLITNVYDGETPIYHVPISGTMGLNFGGCDYASNTDTPSGFNDSGNWDPYAGGISYGFSTGGGDGGGGGSPTPQIPPCEIQSCPVGFNLINCECVEKTKDPCAEAKKNDARASNAVILNQNTEIRTKSTSKEFGAEQNLTTFPPADTPVFKDVPVRSGITNHFVYKFTWNATDGYTIGVSHGHPSGSGPSPGDIVSAFGNLSNSELIAGGQAAIDYYKANFAITVVTKNEAFVINVINWTELGLLYDKYYPVQDAEKAQKTMLKEFKKKADKYLNSLGDILEDEIETKATYQQTVYAALKLYSKAISISKLDKTTLKYTPLVVDAMGEVKSQPCYN